MELAWQMNYEQLENITETVDFNVTDFFISSFLSSLL